MKIDYRVRRCGSQWNITEHESVHNRHDAATNGSLKVRHLCLYSNNPRTREERAFEVGLSAFDNVQTPMDRSWSRREGNILYCQEHMSLNVRLQASWRATLLRDMSPSVKWHNTDTTNLLMFTNIINNYTNINDDQ